MKKIIGIGLVTAALLAGCGGASTGTEGAGTETGGATSANTTAVAGTNTENAAGVPTSETGAGEAADTAADAPAANNATAVTAAGATTADATAQATPEVASNTGDAPGASGTTTDNNGTAGSPNTSTTDGGTTSGTTSDASGTTSDASGTTGAVTGAYQPAGVPDLGLTFQVPEGWEQVNGENAWSPAGVDVPRIGVASADLTTDWRPSSFLPEGATVKSSQQVTLNGMQAMLYTVENSDGTAETHAIMRSGEKAFDIYARAETLQELQTIQPVLNDIVGSVQLSGV